MAEPILELRNANIYQGESLILSDVNIIIDKGEFVYLVGKTGTGKSSLLKTLYGDLEHGKVMEKWWGTILKIWTGKKCLT